MIVYDWQAAEIKQLKHKISKLEAALDESRRITVEKRFEPLVNNAIGSWEAFLQSRGLENDYAIFMYDKFGIQEKE